MEIHIVSYSWVPDSGKTCSWCSEPAVIKIVATPEHLTDYGCDEHVAGHMAGNAHALEPDALRDWQTA